jgi:MarR family transcriptional regulator, transcriptional regulator for hemolysin
MEATIEYETVLNILSGKVVDVVKRPFCRAFARESMTVSSEQYVILACLMKQNLMTQQALCERTKKDKPNVTRLIDRLECKKLVQRIADADDKRKKHICITEQGIAVYEKMNSITQEMVTHATKNIEENQLSIFKNVLQHMITNLSLVV